MSPIVIAPFSNGDIRDWPGDHFARLIRLLLPRWQGQIRVIGTRSQVTRAAAIVRPFDATRVLSDCGRLAWEEVVNLVRGAACVVGNNSGVTHLSASFGVPTICVFAGSHDRAEWRPMGFSARTITRAIGCAPCHLDWAWQCPFGKACLDDIAPELVADVVVDAIAETGEREKANGA
jgi:ADP-heptose:LPS heptosyltransferase